MPLQYYLKITIVTLAITNCVLAHANVFFRDTWQSIYPNSNSDNISSEQGCQLCHRDANGGSPWNAYGWEIRQIYQANGNDMTDAIIAAEENDQDSDPRGADAKSEINSNYQPGWRAEALNTVYPRNDPPIPNQSPPTFPELPTTTGLDFPNAITEPLPDIENGTIAVGLHTVAGGFNAPVKAVRAPGIDGSLFVVEQTGKIFRVDLSTGAKSLFLDVSNDLVNLSSGNDERGLLGLAFHPNYQQNGLFYTFQSEPRRPEQDSQVDFSTVAPSTNFNHRSFIVEYKASDPSCNSYVQKRENLLIIDQPQANHNGGDLIFGLDGFLYISLGDGGSAHDSGFGHGANGNGRDNTNPLGAILRINPTGSSSANGKYGIPADNPFVDVDNTGVDEIFAYGFRNPYRFSVDAMTGELYTGDVGQAYIEEVDIVTKGGNYGWNWQEGSFYFYNSSSTGIFISDVAPPGLPNDLVNPIAEYDHYDGVSVIGGYVYRGADIPELQGRYVFGEFLSKLFYLDANQDIKEFLGSGTNEFITGFGQDVERELYALTRVVSGTIGTNGKLQKILLAGGGYSAPDAGEESAQCPSGEEVCIPIKSANGKVAVICL